MIDRLNANQQQLIKHGSGPLLVVAGAGTGKTTTIVAKIYDLILNKKQNPENIICLTFTEKASQEMEERLDKSLPYGTYGTNITTFHKFSDDIVREEAMAIGYSPNYRLLSGSQQIYFLKKHIFDLPLKKLIPAGRPYAYVEEILKHFSRLQDEDITPEEYLSWTDKNPIKKSEDDDLEIDYELYKELSNAYSAYQKIKQQNDVMDFGDLTFSLIRLFKKFPHLVTKYQKKYPYIFIDEFQDTNFSQYHLIKILYPASSNPNLVVVGDDSQGIYKFRGATVSNILNFLKDYPEAKQIILNDNYRSSQPILDFAYNVIKNNDPDTLEYKLGISKVLKSHTESSEEPIISKLFRNDAQEADWIAGQIKELYENKVCDLSEIAILTRAKDHQQVIINALKQKDIPFQTKGSGNLLKFKDVRNLIAYLKVISNVNDSNSLYSILSLDILEISQKDVVSLNSLAKSLSLSVFQALDLLMRFVKQKDLDANLQNEIKKYFFEEDSKVKFEKIYDLIFKHMQESKSAKIGSILYDFLSESGYINYLKNNEDPDATARAQNISKFFNLITSLENDFENTNISELIEYLNIVESKDDVSMNSELETEQGLGVYIMTVHASKGLEFHTVFLPSLSDGRFPTRSKSEKLQIPNELIRDTLPQGDYHMQEERRLFYVGATRAKQKLILTSSEIYNSGIRKRKISNFVIEGLKLHNDNSPTATTYEQNQLSIFEEPKKIERPISSPSQESITLSFSKMSDYEVCPLKYKYKYVLNIPTKTTSSLSIGSTIHNVLQKFYTLYKENPEVDKNTLLNLLHAYWQPLGYESAKHSESSKDDARKLLSDFYDNFHSKQISILDLEKNFKIEIDSDIKISGKIDRIDKKPDGQLEIIDYKTGESKNVKLKKDDQLTLYALAVADKSMFAQPLEKISLSYYFLKDKKTVTATKDQKSIDAMRDKIISTAEKIKSGDFESKVGFHCQFCEFKDICDDYRKSRT